MDKRMWKREREKKRSTENRGPIRAFFSLLALDPSVDPTQSSLAGSSQPQEDAEIASVL